MKTLSLALTLTLCLSLTALAPAQTTSPAKPGPSGPGIPSQKLTKDGTPEPRFISMHEKFLARAKQGNIDLLFLGDSITEGFNGDVFKQRYEKYNAANFGISGDRTQHVLWRIQNGELEGIKPKVVVILIGVNNTPSDPAEPIADGITKIVETVRNKLPDSKVLLLGVFPWKEKADDPMRAKVKAINQTIAKLDDGKNIRFLDIGEKFLQPDGTMSAEVMRDFLHPGKHGYEIWADAMDPLLAEMMGAPATPTKE
jgi:lysophospholipase L1-like esterase